MAVVRKKQDDKYLQALRELVTAGSGGNRQCFDCGQKGPTYVNMTIGSFVCTRCSGVLRGLTPPHRVKSISMATFTQEEIDFLKVHGNDLCAKTWLGLWDPKRAVHQDHRELMIDKYERKRYYLEPASPLKSLANAATLKSTATSNGNTNNNNNSSSNNTASNHNQQNGHAPLTNGNSDKHSFKNIQLTPPISQRSSSNGGLHKTSTSAISRPHHQQNGHHSHSNGNGFHQQQQDAFALQNGLNSLAANLNGTGSASSIGAMSDTSSCASNGFGADADFVADFGSANIFDATSSSAASSLASTNGYAKIQNIKAAQQHQQQQQQQFINGNANSSSSSVAMANGNTENFADFDHAPIYNAAGTPIPNGFRNGPNHNNNKFGTTPTEDRYAALKDLDEQFRESKAVAAAAASIVSASVVESFGNNNMNGVNANGNGIINPFKSQQANPFQAVNGNGNVNGNNTSMQNLYGQIAVIPNGIVTNGFATTTQQQQQPTGYFNYSNGYAAATTGSVGGMFAPAAAGPNGCGFGFGTMQQQIAATGGGMTGGAFNNPFAATGALNTNNPFL